MLYILYHFVGIKFRCWLFDIFRIQLFWISCRHFTANKRVFTQWNDTCLLKWIEIEYHQKRQIALAVYPSIRQIVTIILVFNVVEMGYTYYLYYIIELIAIFKLDYLFFFASFCIWCFNYTFTPFTHLTTIQNVYIPISIYIFVYIYFGCILFLSIFICVYLCIFITVYFFV